MATERDLLVRRLRTAWGRWDAQLAAGLGGIGGRASRRARRWLAMGLLACLSAMPLAVALVPKPHGTPVSILALLGAGALYGVLANATDKLVDVGLGLAPDEIPRRIGDRYHAIAYLVLIRGYSVAGLIVFLFCGMRFGVDAVTDVLVAVGLPLLYLTASLPGLIAGWTLPDTGQPAE